MSNNSSGQGFIKDMSVYSIKDLEHISGIKAHTIRIWEQRHNLFSPQRTDTNIRFYNEDDLKLILNISLLKKHGMKISKIVQLSSTELHEEVVRVGNSEHSNEDEINALTIAMLEMDEEFFNQTLKTNEEKIGFERTMTEIIYPFFRKIGILWIANSINPAQEHFITHLIRQRLIIETEKLKPSPDFPIFMLFLPEDELHEIGLLYANYILRERGFPTFYLGQSLPTKSLEEVYHGVNPRYLFTVLTSKPTVDKVQDYLKMMGTKFKSSEIFITGNQAVYQELQLPSNVTLIRQFEDLDIRLSEINAKSVVPS